jgi:hypothetical protein
MEEPTLPCRTDGVSAEWCGSDKETWWRDKREGVRLEGAADVLYCTYS